MTKVIAMFNHKGGVSKTTTTFHLAWKLARLGKRVLMVDADPQCNLTGLTLGIADYDSLFRFYDSRRNNDIFSALAPVFGMSSGLNRDIESLETTQITKNENLRLLAGHVRFAEFDVQVATAVTTSENIPVLTDFIGAFNKLIRGAADKMAADIVLLDMGPSISSTNMCLLMGADNFIIPTYPDFYCYQAMDSLAEVFPKWAQKTRQFKLSGILPRNNPKMLGVISSNYRVYTTDKNAEQRTMTAEFKKWAEKIKGITNDVLVPALAAIDMVIPREVFEQNVNYDTPYNLANIQDLNNLMALHQKLSKPVYEITEAEYGSGAPWYHVQNGKEAGARITIEEVNKVYENMAQAILNML